MSCPYPLIKIKTDEDYFKCVKSSEINPLRIISNSLDPKGYQSSQKSLVLKLLTNSVSTPVAWSIDSIYDGSKLNLLELYDIYSPSKDILVKEITISKP